MLRIEAIRNDARDPTVFPQRGGGRRLLGRGQDAETRGGSRAAAVRSFATLAREPARPDGRWGVQAPAWPARSADEAPVHQRSLGRPRGGEGAAGDRVLLSAY